MNTELSQKVAETLPQTVSIYAQTRDDGGFLELQPQGSGFIYREDGIIVTNEHVVRKRSTYIVELQNREQYVAEVVGKSRFCDIAVLAIKPKDSLRAVRLNENVQVGERVFAIGMPFNHHLESTVTFGHTSHTKRLYPEASLFIPAIQSNLTLAKGNSGGGLFDADGRLVGMNTYLVDVQFRVSSSYSFAIRAEDIRWVVERILRTGYGPWKYRLGAVVSPTTKTLALVHGLPQTSGVVVNNVLEKSLAARTGLKQGDLILAIGNDSVNTPRELAYTLMRYEGQKTDISISRDGTQALLPLELRARSKKRTPSVKMENGYNRFGFKLRTQDGVFVEEVCIGSVAALEGFEGGEETILALQDPNTREWIETPDVQSFNALTKQWCGHPVAARVCLGGEPVIMALPC